MNACDCGRGYRCDAYDLPSGDRCPDMARTSFLLDVGFGHPIGVQFCAMHARTYLDAYQPAKFRPGLQVTG